MNSIARFCWYGTGQADAALRVPAHLLPQLALR